MTTTRAPGKIILFGEHAVVYGRPAIAVPVTQVYAEATVEAKPGPVTLHLPDLGRSYTLLDAPEDDPLALTVCKTLDHLGLNSRNGLHITVRSTIPIARGLGSGAAVATATVRALAQHFGQSLSPSEVSDLVYQTEVLLHGTPSGIDNTVIAFEQPVYFVRGKPPEHFAVGAPLYFVIGDTGVPSPTKITVGDVRRAWEANRETYEARFNAIGRLVRQAYQAIAEGQLVTVGALMDANQAWLHTMGLSSPELNRLIEAAWAAGALGAKLSGGGRGGNMIALVTPDTEQEVIRALREAGAANVILTLVT